MILKLLGVYFLVAITMFLVLVFLDWKKGNLDWTISMLLSAIVSVLWPIVLLGFCLETSYRLTGYPKDWNG